MASRRVRAVNARGAALLQTGNGHGNRLVPTAVSTAAIGQPEIPEAAQPAASSVATMSAAFGGRQSIHRCAIARQLPGK
jgi:hypothetical protein